MTVEYFKLERSRLLFEESTHVFSQVEGSGVFSHNFGLPVDYKTKDGRYIEQEKHN
jgi:hypothetical protein